MSEAEVLFMGGVFLSVLGAALLIAAAALAALIFHSGFECGHSRCAPGSTPVGLGVPLTYDEVKPGITVNAP